MAPSHVKLKKYFLTFLPFFVNNYQEILTFWVQKHDKYMIFHIWLLWKLNAWNLYFRSQVIYKYS